MTEPAPRAPDAAAARSWVWHATVESRAAGKVSVLACVETLLAVVLYWWIAIRWDTHWHLLSSVFIAPLLLLRSPESIELGVRWFLKVKVGKDKTKWTLRLWLLETAVLGGLIAYAVAHWMIGHWLVGQTGWPLFGLLVLIGGLSLAIAVAVGFAVMGEFTGEFAVEVAIVSGAVGVIASGGMGAVLSLGLGLGLGLVALAVRREWVFVRAFKIVGVGLGFAIHALVCRVGATLRNLPQGIRQMAENWQENNFWVDSYVPAELMPGIRGERDDLASDGFFRRTVHLKELLIKWVLVPLLSAFLFLPAFLYRLNIKATCWFWWPLAYLLKPVPQADKSSAQKQALCWPWDDPWQRLLIFVPAVLMCAVLIDRYSDFEMWHQYQNPDAVPVPLKLILGMQWSHLPPWHVAMVFIASSGLGMLAISGAACSHKRNDNWDSYAQSGMSKHLWLMNALTKVRSLATGTFLILGLGMCLISFPEWRQRVPDAVMLRLDRFYHAQTAW